MEQFLLFKENIASLQQHYKKILVLVKSGALDVRGGTVTLHFDPNGNLATVTRADGLYTSKYGYPQVP